jgi:hypothetical protein
MRSCRDIAAIVLATNYMVTVGDKFEAGVGLCVGADFY